MENVLLEPVTYYKNKQGKNIRKLIGDLIGKLLGVSNENIELINNIISDMHNASLVIDDIEDNSLLRRNIPCAHIKYGVPLALNAGYYSIFKTLNRITQHFTPATTSKIIKILSILHEGQGMDIYYTHHKYIPSLVEYEKMMIYKTGYVFLLNLELLLDKSTNVIMKKHIGKLEHILTQLAVFFQIRDDYINLTDPEYWKEKAFCQDFDEEKISYLITYFKPISDINVIELMKDKTREGKIKILEIFNAHGLFDNIYDKLMHLKEEILSVMNINIIFTKLPFKKFDLNDAYKFE